MGMLFGHRLVPRSLIFRVLGVLHALGVLRGLLYSLRDRKPEAEQRAQTKRSTCMVQSPTVVPTHRPLSSSFLGLPYRILNINHKKELLRVVFRSPAAYP